MKSSAKVRSATSSQRLSPPARWYSTDLWIAVLLFVITVAVYAQVFNHQFVTYDDPLYVTENAHVQAGLTWDSVSWAFTTFHDSNWFPLTWLSHMLDVQLYGLDSGWHHLTNILLHSVSTVLLFVVLRRMTGSRWASAMVALIFGIHPLHVESVAWIAERKDVLSTLFWMLTLLAYTADVKRPSSFRYVLTLTLFCLGLMAKPMLVTLPVVLLLLDYWPLRRGLRLVEKLPFFAAALASSVVAFIAHQRGGAVTSVEVIPLATRIENAAITYVVYVLKMFWPTSLAVFYPYPLQSIVVPAILSTLLLVAVTVLVLRQAKTHPYLAVGWFWYVVALVPVIGLIQTGAQSHADRYTYIPMIGILIALVWGISDLLEAQPRLQIAIAAIVAIGCITLTWFQVQYWRDSLTLYQHAIEAVPDNYLARFNLASVLDSQGKTEEAVAQLREAVRERPGYVPARAELGQLLAAQGHAEEALQELHKAVDLHPNDPLAHFRLGSVLGTLGRPNEAAAQFSETLRLDPDNPDAHFNLGTALAQQNKLEDAVREFNATLRLRPDDALAHFNLGIALARMGLLNESIAQFTETLRIQPDFAPAQQALQQAMSLQQSPPAK